MGTRISILDIMLNKQNYFDMSYSYRYTSINNNLNKGTISVTYMELIILPSLHVSTPMGHLQKVCIKRKRFKIVLKL
jgi:hypothetical protein